MSTVAEDNYEMKSVAIEKVENGYSATAQYGMKGAPTVVPTYNGGRKFVFSTWSDVERFLDESGFTVQPK